jgi:hypothetical protein
MINLRQKLVALAIMAFVSVGAFAQKDGKRPPKKPDTKVVVQDKEKKPPKNDQNRPKNEGKKGRP